MVFRRNPITVTDRLHLRRIFGWLKCQDLPEGLMVTVEDTRRVLRCPHLQAEAD